MEGQAMTAQPVRLKSLLQQRHWQTYRTFKSEYDKAARTIDPQLVESWPSRAQLHRWLSGELKGLPYPDHCRILEAMLPGWTVDQLFEPCSPDEQRLMVRREAVGLREAEMEQLFDAVATGLHTPDSDHTNWGLSSVDRSVGLPNTASALDVLPAALSDSADGVSQTTRAIGRKLIALAKVLRLSPEETRQLAQLSGNAVDLDLTVDLDIGRDGWAQVSYRHELFNMSTRPITRLSRELWFENTRGHLSISSENDGTRRVVIQRIHDTGNLAKFACQVSPAVRPGETVLIRYTCGGGQFLNDHYWRQALQRYTRHLTINLRHRGAKRLANCTATEEHPDGMENSATEGLVWDYDGDDVVVTLTRDYLRPNQAVTLRWETGQ